METNYLRPLASLTKDGKIALIVLNRPLDVSLLSVLWKNSVYKAVTDGATNHLLDLALSGRTEFVPDLISGDFDSAHSDALDYFKENGKVEVAPTPDQDETDFTKCLRLVPLKTQVVEEAEQIVALGAFGGRLDHCMANINTLYTALSLTRKQVVLIGDNNVACLLDKGSHSISVDTGFEDEYCGLVPIGTPACHVTTTGLKYNLSDQGMRFGDLISTSNSLTGPVVTVTTDQPLLWTQSFKTSCL